MADARIKALRIKTGVVKRLTKEKVMYKKEAESQRARIETLKAQGSDEFVLKKQGEVLQESMMMIPECHRRLAKAFEELKTLLDHEKDLEEQEEYLVAKKTLEEAESELQSVNN